MLIPVMSALRLKNILYATDFPEASRAALPIVAAIARKYGAKIFAAHVWAPLPYSMVTSEELSMVDDKEESDARGVLEKFVRIQDLDGLPVTPIVTCGDTAKELGLIVRQNQIDLAILSMHGRIGLKRLLIGSLADELFRSLPCAVLTVGPNMAKRFDAQSRVKEILFPTDLSYESGAVFSHLAAIATENKSRITLLHVVPQEDRRHSAATHESDNLRHAMHRMFCSQIHPRCEARMIVEAGDPVERILAHASAGKADLIGFGIRKPGEISTRFRNTVPYRVVLQAECPVLTYYVSDSW